MPSHPYCHKLNHSASLKRLFDITAALAGMVIFSPLLLACAAVVACDSPGMVLFTQTRIGLAGKPFTIYKFRTMAAEPSDMLLTSAGDARITQAGKFLRKYKLDEIPQLVNVLLGDMSIVGPRPEVPKYVAYYSLEDAALIFSVRPGITDLASLRYIDEERLLADSADPEKTYIEQIMPKKLAYYRSYARRWSLALDMKIILKTIAAVLHPQR